MSYAATQDLIGRYSEPAVIERTDRTDPPSGVIDMAVVVYALDQASADIDTYIGRRHSLPLPLVPASVTGACTILAWEILHADRPTEAVTAAADRARKWLQQIADGSAVLEGLPVTEVVIERPVGISAPPRVFTDDTLEGF